MVQYPMLRALLLITIGALGAWHFSFGLLPISLALLSVILSLVIHRTRLALWCGVALLGALDMELCRESGDDKSGEGVVAAISEGLHDAAARRLSSLELDEESRRIVASLVIGSGDELPRAVRDDYSLSGIAHLLAISGLHVGLIYLLAFSLLSPLVLLPRGYELRTVLVIASLWIYSFVAALSPSVVRAALMLSLFEAGRCFSLRGSALNTLAAVLFIIVACNPLMIMSLSLQLSAVAVASIILWAQPLLANNRGWIYSNLVLSTCCSIAVLPLVSHYFGYISVLGVLLSPLAVALSFMIIVLAFCAMFLPCGSLLAPLLESLTRALNSLAGWGAGESWGILAWRMEGWLVLVTYTIFAIFAFYIAHSSSKSK